MGRGCGRAWMLAAALASSAVPLAGAGIGPTHGPIAHAAAPGDPERAAELRARAGTLMKQIGTYPEAAVLLRQAAALTPAEDADRANDLHVAANLLFLAGSTRDAQAVMVQAGDAALARGDVQGAADAYVDAGWLAARRHQRAEAHDFAVRALHLAASPLLTDEQRDQILQRVVVPKAAGASAGGSVGVVGRTGWSVAAQRLVPARKDVRTHGPVSRAEPPA